MIGTIENAIIDHLKAINDSNMLGYKFRQIKTYGGELRAQADRAKISDVPAAWLAYLGGTKNQHTGSYTRVKERFMLLLATGSLRNERAARHGVAGEVGVYQIINDMVGIFDRLKIHDKSGALYVTGIDPVSNEEFGNGRLAVYAIGLSIEVQYGHIPTNVGDVGVEVDLTNFLESVHTNWDLPPVGEVGPDIPDDENANATSHVTGD